MELKKIIVEATDISKTISFAESVKYIRIKLLKAMTLSFVKFRLVCKLDFFYSDDSDSVKSKNQLHFQGNYILTPVHSCKMRYLFLIARTPAEFRNPIREKLWQLTMHSLAMQTSENWRALVVDEEEWEDNKITGFNSNAKLKFHKIIAGLDEIKKRSLNPQYIIRLDDDDIISPTILSEVEGITADCIAESYHNYVDLVYLRQAQTKRSWLANTVIHKFEYAVSEDQKNKLPLLSLDHSKYWFDYYSEKKIHWLPKKTMLYQRIISPSSITSRNTYSEEPDFKAYLNYLNSFGKWKHLPEEFNYYKELSAINANHFMNIQALPGNNFFNFFKFKK